MIKNHLGRLSNNGWQIVENHSDSIVFNGSKIHRFGIAAQNKDGLVITGSSADLEGKSEVRAWGELFERLTIVDANYHATSFKSQSPEWAFARSNGVAYHTSIFQAEQNAKCELIERHLILKSWYGVTKPIEVQLPDNEIVHSLKSSYETKAYTFGSLDGIHCIAFFCFPLDQITPLIYGFGAAVTIQLAIEKALNEAVQRLAFLWGESIDQNELPIAANANFHQEFYLRPNNHFRIKNWLNQGNVNCIPDYQIEQKIEFKAIRLDSNLLKDDHVVAVQSQSLIPLSFGTWNPVLETLAPSIDFIHPIA